MNITPFCVKILVLNTHFPDQFIIQILQFIYFINLTFAIFDWKIDHLIKWSFYWRICDCINVSLTIVCIVLYYIVIYTRVFFFCIYEYNFRLHRCILYCCMLYRYFYLITLNRWTPRSMKQGRPWVYDDDQIHAYKDQSTIRFV